MSGDYAVGVVMRPGAGKQCLLQFLGSCVCGDFRIAVKNAANWRIFLSAFLFHRDCPEGREAILAGLSLGLGIPFPGKQRLVAERTGSKCGD
jgi:hypothetical protein